MVIRPQSVHTFEQTPQSSPEGNLFFQNLTVGRVMGTFSTVSTTNTTFSTAAATLTVDPHFFPSPFRLSTGSELGYGLDTNADVELRIYNMRADEVYRRHYPAGSVPGGTAGYNKVPFSAAELGHNQLPSGIYFFVLLHEGKVLGKGKFALLP